jgi:Cu-processing system permease protein
MLGVWLALSAAQLIGFGAAALVVHSQAGPDGLWRYGVLAATAIVVTGIFLAIATVLAAANPGRRTRVQASGLVVWFVAVILFDVAAMAAASLLRSGSASRLLISATLINPVDAARTGALLAIEGTSAFGAASLALQRFAGGMGPAVLMIGASLAAWLIAPLCLAARTLRRADI